MDIVSLILASGQGKRLYPLSTEEKPKQFLKLFKNESMLLQTVKRFAPFIHSTFIVTLKRYAPYLENSSVYSVVYEEKKRETANSVFQGLKEIQRVYPEEELIVIQSPSDHYIEYEGFEESIEEGIELAKKGYTAIIGVEPRYPESDYGYTKEEEGRVDFIQKPNQTIAALLQEKGYLWNTAIYIYPLQKMISHYEEMNFQGQEGYFESIILQDLSNLKVVKGSFYWSDIGNFNRLNSVATKRGEAEDGKEDKTNT